MNTILLTTPQRLSESHDKHQFSLSKVFTVLLINLKIATSIKYHFNHQRLRWNIKYCHGEFPLYCRHSHRQWTKRVLRDLCREDHLMPQKFLFILSFSPVAIAWPCGYVELIICWVRLKIYELAWVCLRPLLHFCHRRSVAKYYGNHTLVPLNAHQEHNSKTSSILKLVEGENQGLAVF